MGNEQGRPSKWKQYIFKAVSTTEVTQVIELMFGRQAVVRLLDATGAHASSKITMYVPLDYMAIRLSEDATSTATSLYLDVDTAAGHVVRGHTLTTNDFILVQSSTGLALRQFTAVTDDAGEDYCHVTVDTLTNAPEEGSKVWIIRAADVVDLTVGAASITRENLVSAPNSVPFVISATSGDATDTTVSANVEYIDN